MGIPLPLTLALPLPPFPPAWLQKVTEGELLCQQVAFGSHLISFGRTVTTRTPLSWGPNMEFHGGSLRG